jgi:hypothetical protein
VQRLRQVKPDAGSGALAEAILKVVDDSYIASIKGVDEPDPDHEIGSD